MAASHRKDLHGVCMQVCGSEEMLQAVAVRFIDFPLGEDRSPDIRFSFSSVESAEFYEIRRPERPGRPFYQAAVGEALYFADQDELYIDYGPRARVFCRPADGEWVVSVLRPEADQRWLATHPLFTIPLLEMLKRRGKYGIHAAAVARNDRSIILPGSSGAGKSTLTIALIRSGFDFLGDDITLVEDAEGLKTLAFPEKADLTEETLPLFAELRSVDREGRPAGWPKYQLRMSDFYQSNVAWRTTPAAIVFPRVVQQHESLLLPLEKKEAFLHLSASVLLTERDSTREHIKVLSELANSLPVFRLLSGRDLDQSISLLGKTALMIASPETTLVLEGSRVRPDMHSVERMREQIARGLDWSEVLRIAIPHGVLPLLAGNLAVHASDVMPPVTLVEFEIFRKKVARRNLEQSLELVKLISAFSSEGIRVLPFKGPTLAIGAYGDLNLRESHDLDFWVEPSRFTEINKWFRAEGYHPVEHVEGIARRVSVSEANHREFSSPNGKVFIEVKDHLEPSGDAEFDPPFDRVWERRAFTTLHSFTIPILSVEDLLLGLAAHGSKHIWRRLNWIVDLAAVIAAHPRIDWEAMLLRAAEWRCRRRLLVAVSLANTIYGIDIPAAYRRAAQEPIVRLMVSHICSSLFAQLEGRLTRGFSARVLCQLGNCDTTGGCLRVLRDGSHDVIREAKARVFLPMSASLRRVYRGAGSDRA